MAYDSQEQDDILEQFTAMLKVVTQDGGNKRAAGTKVSWKEDQDHVRGFFSHVGKWADKEVVDLDSGAHPLVHAAWRALAIAWQENRWIEQTNKWVERVNSYEEFTTDE